MRGITLSLVALFSAAAIAKPIAGADRREEYDCKDDSCPYYHDKPEPCRDCCLTGPIARRLAEDWNYFFVNLYPRRAMATLTEDFKLYSDSDNILESNPPPPPGAPTYASRDEFIADQPTFFNVSIPNAYVNLDVFHDCSKIVLRWVAPRGFPEYVDSNSVIRGIDTLETVSWGNHWKIRKAYSEYNNVAFLADVNRCDVCTALQQTGNGPTGGSLAPGAPANSFPRPGTTGLVPGLTGAIPGLTGAVPGLTGAVPGLTGAVPGLTGAVPGLTGAVPGLTGAVP